MGLSLRGIRSSRVLNAVGLVAVGLFVLGPALAKLHLAPAIGGVVLFALRGALPLGGANICGVPGFRGRRFRRGGVPAGTGAGLRVFLLAVGSGGFPAPLTHS